MPAIFPGKKPFLLSLESDCLVLTNNRGKVTSTAIVAEHQPPWIAALAAVRARLADPGCRGCAIDITLSESYYHLALVNADTDRLDDGEIALVARHHFRTILGDSFTEYDYRCAAIAGATTPNTLLCCAIDAQGIAGLQEAAAEAGCTIHSLLPRLATFTASHADDVRSFTGHLVLSDAHTALLASLRDGAWLQVAMRRTDNTPGWLATALGQAEMVAPPGARLAWIAGRAQPAELSGWQMRRAHDYAVGLAA